MVSFCYIDEGIISTPGFETLLRQYSDLFVALGHIRVVWVGKKRGNMRSASRIFHRLFNSAEGMRERFKHPRHDHLFKLWKQDGDAAIRQELGGNDAARTEFRARIQIYPMSYRYDFL
jgi:hypothetical protein